MNISIDYQSRIPIYEQVVEEIERLVALNVLKPSEQILSIRDLACTLGVNPNTIKKAYDILENKNVIVFKSTKGTFVVDNIDEVINAKIDSLFADVKSKIVDLEKYGLNKKNILNRLEKEL